MAEDDLLAAAAGGIVVGMDDSESARAALAWAIGEANQRQVSVLALTVFHSPSAWSPRVAALINEERLAGEFERGAKQVVDEVIAQEKSRGVAIPLVRVGLRHGSPADVLCRLSRESLMLVIGDRGRGEVASRLIGSVVLGVVLNAWCPVLVVHPQDLRPPVDPGWAD